MATTRGGKKLEYKKKGRNHKKDYQAFIRSQRRAGMINDKDGKWRRADLTDLRSRALWDGR